MAYSDLVTSTAATASVGATAVLVASRSTSGKRHFLLALFGLCLYDVVVTIPHVLFVLLEPIKGGVVFSAAILASHVATTALHLPSIIALGGDENLERHGVLVTTIGHVLDLVFWAGATWVAGSLLCATRRRPGGANEAA
jgi:hypothetical protein